MPGRDPEERGRSATPLELLYDLIYVIASDRCTECVGAEDEPQCMLVCPADCIVPNPDFSETPEELLAKYEAIHG